MNWHWMRWWVVVVVWLTGGPVWGAGMPAEDLRRLLAEAETVLAGVTNYTAVFRKQERVEGKLLKEERIELKFRKPFSVYMNWLKGPHEGREVLYVQGVNEGRLKAHEGGLLGAVNVNLDPNGARAMKGNRHPVTDTGLHKLVELLRRNVELGVERGELEAFDQGEEFVLGRKTRKVEGRFSKEQLERYYCWRAVVNLDVERKVPVRVQIFDKDDVLLESYGYESLKLNAGLGDADFDPANPAYRF